MSPPAPTRVPLPVAQKVVFPFERPTTQAWSGRGAPGQSQWARFDELANAGEQDVLSRNDTGDESAVSADKLGLEPVEKILVAHRTSRGVNIFFMPDAGPLQLRHHRRRYAERLCNVAENELVVPAFRRAHIVGCRGSMPGAQARLDTWT